MAYRGRWLPLRLGILPGREEWHGRPVAIRGDRRPAHIQADVTDLIGGDACRSQLRRIEASRNVEQSATSK